MCDSKHEVFRISQDPLSTELEGLCRLCLQPAQCDIFSTGATDTQLDIAQTIQYALDVTVCKDDGLPQRLCRNCLHGVQLAASLKQTAHDTQRALQLQYTKEKYSIEIENTVKCEAIDSNVNLANAESIQDLNNGLDCKNAQHTDYYPNCDGVEDADYVDKIESKDKSDKADLIQKFHKERKAKPQPDECNRTRGRKKNQDSAICELCGKQFKNKFHLKRHLAVHSSDLAYACDRCPYKTRWSTALVHHKRVHDGERPLLCPHCPARFVSPSNLASHRRTHFPPTFKCETCERVFTKKQGLENHIVSQHTNIKAYMCHICDKPFSTRRLLRRHELKSHGSAKRRAGSVPVYIQIQQDQLNL